MTGIRKSQQYKKFVTLSFIFFICGCTNTETTNPYNIPDNYFRHYDESIHGDYIPLILNFLENVSYQPKNECEREDLRQLFITADWQMHEFHNQGYPMDTKSSGISILFEAFPELLNKNILRERGNIVMSYGLKNELLKINTKCSRGNYPY